MQYAVSTTANTVYRQKPVQFVPVVETATKLADTPYTQHSRALDTNLTFEHIARRQVHLALDGHLLAVHQGGIPHPRRGLQMLHQLVLLVIQVHHGGGAVAGGVQHQHVGEGVDLVGVGPQQQQVRALRRLAWKDSELATAVSL
jgi:hypothetical protein